MANSSSLSERLNTPISTAELERRWAAVRAAMAREKIDVLLMQNNNDHMGGYVRYFTDMPATNGYPNTVVFPRDDEMSVVCQGPFGGSETTAQGDLNWRGVKKIMTTPSYASAHYTKDYDPELAAKALEPYRNGTIGYVGTYQMSYAMLDYIKRALPKARYVDASDLVDRIKVIKSPEEMDLVKRAAAMQDGAMRAAFAAVKPACATPRSPPLPSITASATAARTAFIFAPRCRSARRRNSATSICRTASSRRATRSLCWSRITAPGGMYTELGRSCVVGVPVPQAMKDELAFCIEARKMTLDLLKPGTKSKDVWDGFNAFMRKNGRPMEARLYCHGQGYDLVERPLVRNDEPMTIEKDMNIVVHPTYIHAGYLNWLCDNYLIGG
ncbi:MAG: M24 family metallopeptidase [Pseudolabrys sp.]